MSSRKFLTLFDCLGFETIIDVTDYEHKKLINDIKGTATTRLPVNEMVLRAKFNEQRRAEVWLFTSEIPLDELTQLSADEPQLLADSIRRVGYNLYKPLSQVGTIIAS